MNQFKSRLRKFGRKIGVLPDVQPLLSKEERWIKGRFAVNKRGVEVRSENRQAVKFCLIGAIYHVYHYNSSECQEAIIKIGNVLASKGFRNIFMFNDAPERTHAEVLAVIKEANI